MLYIDKKNKMVDTFSKVSECVKQTSVIAFLLIASIDKKGQKRQGSR